VHHRVHHRVRFNLVSHYNMLYEKILHLKQRNKRKLWPFSGRLVEGMFSGVSTLKAMTTQLV
jgi:hypothetical protein